MQVIDLLCEHTCIYYGNIKYFQIVNSVEKHETNVVRSERVKNTACIVSQ